MIKVTSCAEIEVDSTTTLNDLIDKIDYLTKMLDTPYSAKIRLDVEKSPGNYTNRIKVTWTRE